MSTKTESNSNAILSRILALAIAVVLGFGVYLLWHNNIKERPPAPVQPQTLSEIGTPPDVAACLTTRLAEIEALADEGLMDEDSVALSRARARTLCIQRN
jgi:hypothetical protein